MKKSIFLIVILFTGSVFLSYTDLEPPITRKVVNPITVKPKPIINHDNLIQALIQVESSGIEDIKGDLHLKGGPSIGVLQIRPVMVREVNRILKILKVKKRFKLKDRYDREKSIEMFVIWRDFHHPDGDFETIARNWNGGPKGIHKTTTIAYWNKVKNHLEL